MTPCSRMIVMMAILVLLAAALVTPVTSLQLRGERRNNDAKPTVTTGLTPQESSAILVVDDNHPSLITDEDGRQLKKATTYVDPIWFDEYKAIAGKFFKRCQFQNNVAPTNGTTCPKMNIGSYSCAFDTQICPDGSTHPKIKCDCIRGAGPRVWSCQEYQPCAVTPPTTVCPKDHPMSFNPPLTCANDMECPIGTQKCCGTTFPRYMCTCKGGVFDCEDDQSCSSDCEDKSTKKVADNSTTAITLAPPNPIDEQCPNLGSLIPPVEGTQCSVPSNQTCSYDKTCCCDSCADRFQCHCMDGKWTCAELAFDCFQPCFDPNATCPVLLPDAGQFAPSGKCSVTPDKTCSYGKSCCCNNCIDATTCRCQFGEWQCATVSLACVENCPPSTDGQQCMAGDPDITQGEVVCCQDRLPEWVCKCTNGVYKCTLANDPKIICDCIDPLPTPIITIDQSVPLPAIHNQSCTVGDPVFEYGEFNCCGSILPVHVCTCEAPGHYSCALVNPPWIVCSCAAPIDVTTQCPIPMDENSALTGSCSLPEDTLCTHGKICCCDNCIDRFSCNCVDGEWVCNEVAFRCAPCVDPTAVCPVLEDPNLAPSGSCNLPSTQPCSYAKLCCCENCVDRFQCSCDNGVWQCNEVALKCSFPCPLTNTTVTTTTPKLDGQQCSVGSIVEVGQFQCCDTLQPEWICRCGIDGIYKCTHENPPGFVCDCAVPIK